MSDEWCAHGPSRNCKDCEIERLEANFKLANEQAKANAIEIKVRGKRIAKLEAKQKYLCDCLEAVGIDSSSALQAEPLAALNGEQE